MAISLFKINGVQSQLVRAQVKHRIVLCGVSFFSLAMLTAGLVPSTSASLEVLSGMDCVVEPSATIELGSAVPGLLAETFYDRSDFVSAGTVVARLENDIERASLAIAEHVAASSTAIDLRQVTASFGSRTLTRNLEMLKTSGISKQVVDQVDTESKIAHLQVHQEQESRQLALLEVERAKSLLDRKTITSPIDGTIVQRYMSTGEYVDSEPVFQIAQLHPLNVEVILPVDYLNSVETGMSAAITLDVPGFENDSLRAVVRRIDAVADAASATYGVRLTLDNPDYTIPSGVRCQVDFYAS